MSIGKENSTRRKPINMRRMGLRVAFEAPHPIVEIIDGNEQNMGSLRSVIRRRV